MRKPPQNILQYHISQLFTVTSAIYKQYAQLQTVQQHPSYTRLPQAHTSENIYSRQYVPPSITSPPTPSTTTYSDENSMNLFSKEILNK